jgi:predicted O-methyltransferase YrrM
MNKFNPNSITTKQLKTIIGKYVKEIDEFSYKFACLAARDDQLNGKGAFCDVEGILLYCLIRHYKPKLFFEISPDTGMSTNYILQAIGKNGEGKVIGFELEENKQQGTLKSTLQTIKENAVNPLLIDKHYKLVIGDATKTCNIEIFGKPDGVLIDSCHEDWFAQWYLNDLIPHVKKFSLIQDISYVHRREKSTEAETVINYLENKNVNRILVGNLRGWIESHSNHFPIRDVLSNSILLSGNEEVFDQSDFFPDIGIYELAIQDKSILADRQIRQKLLKASIPGSLSQFAPRYLAKILPFEPNPFLQNKIIHLMFGSLEINRYNQKDFRYCLVTVFKHRKELKQYKLLKVLLRLILSRPWLTIKILGRWIKDNYIT